MTGVKTNERPGTRAVLRYCNMSGYKVREVLDLVRGMEYSRAVEVLDHTDRAAATVVAKLLRSAAANAEHNDGLDPEELYVATAYADEGATLKRWRPRARGRASRIRKRSCHITVVLALMPAEQLARRRARVAAEAAERRARRVAGGRRRRTGEGEVAGGEVTSSRRGRRRGRGEAEVATEGAPPSWTTTDVDPTSAVESLTEPEEAVAPGLEAAGPDVATEADAMAPASDATAADEAGRDAAAADEAGGDETSGAAEGDAEEKD